MAGDELHVTASGNLMVVDTDDDPRFDTVTLETSDADESIEFGAIPGNNFGVAYYRPTKTTSIAAFDVSPNGSPASVSGYGYSWMDVCSVDVSQAVVPVQCAHVAIRSDFAEFSMRAFNASSKLPAVFGVGDDSNVTECFRSNTDGTFQFGAANIIANASVATAMSSVGPTGSRTTIQKWFIIKDASGNPFYVPAW
jgi:hypothetical protein